MHENLLELMTVINTYLPKDHKIIPYDEADLLASEILIINHIKYLSEEDIQAIPEPFGNQLEMICLKHYQYEN